ncbi:MAG: hypothetical protein ABIA75_01555 [Candidatus Neomarinimicrobiota bacterium]
MSSIPAIISLLGLAFAAVYPLCLWLVSRETIPRFLYWQLLSAGLAGLLGFGLLWYFEVAFQLRLSGAVWLTALFATNLYYWGSPKISAWVTSIPSVFGLIVLFQVSEILIYPSIMIFVIQVLNVGLLGIFLLFTVRLRQGGDNTQDDRKTRFFSKAVLTLLAAKTVWATYSILWGDVKQMPGNTDWRTFIVELQGHLPLTALFFGLLVPILVLMLVPQFLKELDSRRLLALLYPTVAALTVAVVLSLFYLFQFGIIL